MNRKNLFTEGLDWTASGYFIQPISSSDLIELKGPTSTLWIKLQDIILSARSGDFDDVDKVIDLFVHGKGDEMFRLVCSVFLGDAGTKPCFCRMIEELDNVLDPVMSSKFCRAFVQWGGLSAASVILREFQRYRGFTDVEIFPLYLSAMLEQEWGPISNSPNDDELDAYVQLVTSRCDELEQTFKTKQVNLFFGERFGVIRVAKTLLNRLSNDYFDMCFQIDARHRFEASTGIDCTTCFANGAFQPLHAAALLELFLDRSNEKKYEDGVRYFFGHRIPD